MLAMLILSRSGLVPAVARDVGGLAVLPLVVVPSPRVGAVAYNTHQHTSRMIDHERRETECDFGEVGGTPSEHAEIDETKTHQ